MPLYGSALAVATNLTIVWLGYPRFGYRAIAVGTATGSLLNAAMLIASFERLLGGLRGQGLARPLVRMLASAAAMGALAWATATGLELWLGPRGLLARLLTCLVPVTLGVSAYAALTRALHVDEAQTIGRMLLARLRGRPRVLRS